MVEIIIAVAGLVGGFLIAIGWYRRGLVEMEKEIKSLKSRMDSIEKDNQGVRTDIEVIKQRIGYMESMISDMHGILMRPAKIVQDD